MVLTDYEEKVLLNLRDCVAANACKIARQPPQQPDGGSGAAEALDAIDDNELFGEGAEECDDLDGFLGAAAAAPDAAHAARAWDHVRALALALSLCSSMLEAAYWQIALCKPLCDPLCKGLMHEDCFNMLATEVLLYCRAT